MVKSPNPLVSVCLPICNGEAFIESSVQTILNQTFRDFELLIIDNASTDATPAILAKLAKSDARIRILTNPKNIGVVASLNRGLKEAKGTYYARMDGDDLAHPRRLAEQVAYMESHPGTIALGTWAQKFGQAVGLIRTPMHPAMAKASLMFLSPLVHPTVMLRLAPMRKAKLTYRPECPVEDFDLWTQLAKLGDITSLPLTLLNYRVHNASMTSLSTPRRRGFLRVTIRQGLELFLKPQHIPPFCLEMHSRFACHERLTLAQAAALPFWLLFLTLAIHTPAAANVILQRIASYTRAALTNKLLQPPEEIYSDHDAMKKHAF